MTTTEPPASSFPRLDDVLQRALQRAAAKPHQRFARHDVIELDLDLRITIAGPQQQVAHTQDRGLDLDAAGHGRAGGQRCGIERSEHIGQLAEFVAGAAGKETGLASRILEASFRTEIPRMFAALVLVSPSENMEVKPSSEVSRSRYCGTASSSSTRPRMITAIWYSLI